MGSPHENGRTVPLVQDSKGRRVKDRLQNIDTAMAWIKEELVSAERGEGRGGGWVIPRFVWVLGRRAWALWLVSDLAGVHKVEQACSRDVYSAGTRHAMLSYAFYEAVDIVFADVRPTQPTASLLGKVLIIILFIMPEVLLWLWVMIFFLLGVCMTINILHHMGS